MLKKNSKKVLDIIATQNPINATQAYKAVHPDTDPKVAKVQASRLMAKPEAQIYLKQHIDKARETIVDLMQNSEKDDIRLRSAVDVLDRSHGRAVQQIQQATQSININIDLTDTFKDESDN